MCIQNTIKHVIKHQTSNDVIASYGHSHLGTSQFVSATFQIGQCFLGSNQTIQLLINNRKTWKES